MSSFCRFKYHILDTRLYVYINKALLRLSGLLSILSLLISSLSVSASDQVAREPQIRAAIIVGVLRYSQYDLSKTKNKTINICHIGKISSGETLLKSANKVVIKGNKVKFTHITQGSSYSNCQVMIFGEGITIRIPQNLRLLTICDGCNSSRFPSIITLRRVNQRLVFNVDLTRAKSVGIRFSSDMLELASHVKGASR